MSDCIYQHRSGLSRCRGFTLIEMAIVMVIIGILISITMPLMRTMVTQAKQAEERAAITGASKALLGYAMSLGGFPESLANDALPAGVLGVAQNGPYAKPLIYDVNDALTLTATGGDLNVFCSSVQSEQALRNPPMVWDAQDYSDPLLSNPVALVIVSQGKNLQTNGENLPLGDGTLGDRTYENPSLSEFTGYDDHVSSLSLSHLYDACIAAGVSATPPPATPPPIPPCAATGNDRCATLTNNSGVVLYRAVASNWNNTAGICLPINDGETHDLGIHDKNRKLYVSLSLEASGGGDKCNDATRVNDKKLKDIDTNGDMNAVATCSSTVDGSCVFL